VLETPGLAELPTISKHGGSGPDPPGLYRISGGAGVFAVPWLTAPMDEDQRSAAASRWLPLHRQCDHARRSDQAPALGCFASTLSIVAKRREHTPR
jgi:hypothetical protein